MRSFYQSVNKDTETLLQIPSSKDLHKGTEHLNHHFFQKLRGCCPATGISVFFKFYVEGEREESECIVNLFNRPSFS